MEVAIPRWSVSAAIDVHSVGSQRRTIGTLHVRRDPRGAPLGVVGPADLLTPVATYPPAALEPAPARLGVVIVR